MSFDFDPDHAIDCDVQPGGRGRGACDCDAKGDTMNVLGHWLATPPDPEPEQLPVSVLSRLTAENLTRQGWTVTGPFVPAEQLKGAVGALREFGTHKINCALAGAIRADNTPRPPCNCGWTDALATVGGQ